MQVKTAAIAVLNNPATKKAIQQTIQAVSHEIVKLGLVGTIELGLDLAARSIANRIIEQKIEQERRGEIE